jgi:hypothetical protein
VPAILWLSFLRRIIRGKKAGGVVERSVLRAVHAATCTKRERGEGEEKGKAKGQAGSEETAKSAVPSQRSRTLTFFPFEERQKLRLQFNMTSTRKRSKLLAPAALKNLILGVVRTDRSLSRTMEKGNGG